MLRVGDTFAINLCPSSLALNTAVAHGPIFRSEAQRLLWLPYTSYQFMIKLDFFLLRELQHSLAIE